ncbi:MULTISPECIES: hypothetical protein [unclassified Niallia]|uniref:DUF6980 family protein n=1 Tax=Niallia TaxID=2837506 RepID=UPI002056B910|nr:hypothetical protein [Niallia sp. Man26]UPO90311.1 hypothetical protein L8T27_019760 [Niallia sp. Man26]
MSKHCCEMMTGQINYKGEFHTNESDCPDILVSYHEKFDEYGLIIHDGGSSSIQIFFCPWCGTKLPESKSDLWFDTLAQLGFDDPVEQNIPKEFHTNKWYTKGK